MTCIKVEVVNHVDIGKDFDSTQGQQDFLEFSQSVFCRVLKHDLEIDLI